MGREEETVKVDCRPKRVTVGLMWIGEGAHDKVTTAWCKSCQEMRIVE